MKILLLLAGCAAVFGQITDFNESEKELRPEFRFFGAKSTTTYTDVSLVTVTVFSSCIRTISTVAAVGVGAAAIPAMVIQCRGRRSSRKLISNLNQEVKDDGLSTSLADSATTLADSATSDTDEIEFKDQSRSGKFVTVWTTARTTATVTIKTTNSATTLSLMYQCTNGLIQYPKYSCIVG